VGCQRHAPAALLPGKTRHPLYMRLGGPQSWSGQVRKISPAPRIRAPDRPARSESLYRLSYPAPYPRGDGGKCGRGVKLTTHLHPVSSLTIRSNTTIPARVFVVCRTINCKDCFTFKKWNDDRTDATELTCHFRLGNQQPNRKPVASVSTPRAGTCIANY